MLFHYDWISVPLVYTQVTLLRLSLHLVSEALTHSSPGETESQLRPHHGDARS